MNVRTGLGLVTLAALTMQTNCAGAVDLALPSGYFNGSGGFYSQGSGECACPRFAAAGGCVGATNYPAAAHFVYGDAHSAAATYSWYASQVPTYRHGGYVPCRRPQPALAPADPSGERREDVGPGLPQGHP